MTSIRAQLFGYASAQVERILAGIDDEGKVWLDGAWGIMNQDVVLPLAVLGSVPHPANAWYGKPEVIEACHRIAEGTFALQDDLGRVEFVKPDGSRWGWIHMPWLFYGLAETYGLLLGDVPELRRMFWRGRLELVYNRVLDDLRNPASAVHNIPTWHSMALVVAGKLMGRPDWHQAGTTLVRRAAAAQDEDGCWPEGTGPTTLYNLVYVHSLGVYHHVTGDPAVLPALRRAGRFHELLQYPDGSLVALVDGRVRYHPRRHTFGLPGLWYSAEGRRYLARWRDGELPLSVQANGWTGLGSAMLHLDDEHEAPPEASAPQGELASRRARMAVHGAWTVAASAFTGRSETAHRWHMDRLQHLAVHHRRGGLVIGGGNAKGDPAMAQARVKVGDDEGVWLADEAEVLDSPDHLVVVRTSYGRGQVTWRARAESDDLWLEVGYAGEGTCTVSLQLWAEPNDEVALGDEAVVLGEVPLARWCSTVTRAGCRLEASCQGAFAWPLQAFNPYTADGSAPLEDAVATWSFALTDGDPVAVRLAAI